MGKHGKAWEILGFYGLLSQLRLAKELDIFLIGQLPWVPIEVEGLHTYANFEVTEILNYTDLYPTLLGIGWSIGNHAVINIKNRIF